MTSAEFPESNARVGPPVGMAEVQGATVGAYGGSCDGVPMVITAWRPSPEELAELNAGGLIYLTCIGGLPPHFLTTNFQQAKNPA